MSEEQKIVQETAAVEEEQAPPALPTTEPPKDDVGKPAEGEVSEAPKPDEKPAEEPAKEDKPASRIFKRPTLKWGKKRDELAPKEPEQAKDIRDDAVGWIAQQIPPAVHKVNYFVLDWAQKLAYGDAERPALPGKDGSVTRNQFLAYLRDGKLLAALANKLQPGAVNVEPEATAVSALVTESTPSAEPEKANEAAGDAAEPSKEGEEKVEEPAAEPAKVEDKPAPTQKTQKEKQTEIVNQFVGWVRATLGLEEGKGMTAADLLEKGKAGYPAVFDALWQLAQKAQGKFQQEGIDVDAVLCAASQVVRTNIIQSILNFFKRRPAPVADKKDEPADQAQGDPTEVAPNAPEGEQVVEEECKKVESLSSAAVAAN